jgi:hypothetical protein
VTEIEFLDPGPADEPGEHVAPVRSARLAAVPRFTAVPLLLTAAALAVAAPFGTVYRVSVTQGEARPAEQSVDGWGRFTVNFDPGVEGYHGPRDGIVFAVVAAALLAAGGLRLAGVLRPPGRHDAGRRLAGTLQAAAGGAALAAGAAAVWLSYLSTRDIYEAQDRQAGRNSDGLISTLPSTHVSTGACLWLALAGAGCAVLAVAAALLADSRRPAAAAGSTPGTEPQPLPPPAPHAPSPAAGEPLGCGPLADEALEPPR